MNNIGIYIHFPFCASKCKYCNFNSYSNKNDLQIKYFQSLLKEIENCASQIGAKELIIPASVYGCEFYRKMGYEFYRGIKTPNEDEDYILSKNM